MIFVDTLYCSSKLKIKKSRQVPAKRIQYPQPLLDVADSLGAHSFSLNFL